MVMRRDPTEFRKRFKAYKEGKKPYENGLPAYKGGKKLSKFTQSLSGKHRHIIDDTVDYMLGQGVDPILISGILGNMAQESMFDPDSVGPGGFAGTVQMSSDMAKEIKRAYGKVDYKTTNKFIHDAMSGNKIISQPWRNYMKQKGGYYGRAFSTASDAAMAFGRVFERPNEKYANWASRKASAEDALSYVRQRQSNMYSPLDSRDYNYQRAIQLGYTPDNTGHWPSRDIQTGEYLKSATHPTIMKTVVSDIAEGYNPTYNQNTGKLGSQTWMKPLLPKPVYDFESGEIKIPFVDSDEPSYKNGKLPGYYLGKDNGDLEVGASIGASILKKPEYINNKKKNFLQKAISDKLYKFLYNSGGEVPTPISKHVKYTGSYKYPDRKQEVHSQATQPDSFDNGPRDSYLYGGQSAEDTRNLLDMYVYGNPTGLKYLRDDNYVLGGDTLYTGPFFEGKIFPVDKDSVYNITTHVKPLLDRLIDENKSLRINANQMIIDRDRFPKQILDNVKHARVKPLKDKNGNYYLKATKLWDMGGTLGIKGWAVDKLNKISGGSPFVLEQTIPIKWDNNPSHQYNSDWKYIENTLVNEK